MPNVVDLRNGATVRLRPIAADDAPRLLALSRRLSPRTVYERFFSPRRLRPEDAQELATVDYRERMAIVAETEDEPESQVVGVARYGRSSDGTIDIGLLVADGWQGLGLGSRLLEKILAAGEERGIHEFSAHVLTENRRALRLLAGQTNIKERSFDGGVVRLVFTRRTRELEPAPAG